ncbi:MAG: imidazolonepropionase [Candidatus Alcyoniella australis]|nr:imidazolonepropionase [Candidatus Alcyoniella australis]
MATMAPARDKCGVGVTRDDLGLIDDAALLCNRGSIVEVGSATQLEARHPDARRVELDQALVTPALIDPHTHLVFAGSRHAEFEQRSQGATYLEIAQAGGGILSTVRATRRASVDELTRLGERRLQRFMGYGAGTIEVKSGYGLNVESELRQLQAIADLTQIAPVTLVPTFLGAHAVPPEYRDDPEGFVALVIDRMLPAVAQQGIAKFCDVFCEPGFFSREQSRRILIAAREHGLKLKIHADEFENSGGAQLAAELGCVSADHLLAIDADGIRALADSGCVAVLLPGTALFLGKSQYAPARRLLDAGVRVAISTDFNPGSCFSENLALILSLACTNMGMSAAETLCASTVNAAAALGLDDRGALAPGLRADFAAFDAPDYSSLPYHMGQSTLSALVLGGERVL